VTNRHIVYWIMSVLRGRAGSVLFMVGRGAGCFMLFGVYLSVV